MIYFKIALFIVIFPVIFLLIPTVWLFIEYVVPLILLAVIVAGGIVNELINPQPDP